MNLPFANGDESWELPIPATFIGDRDATVIYAAADEDYMERPRSGRNSRETKYELNALKVTSQRKSGLKTRSLGLRRPG